MSQPPSRPPAEVGRVLDSLREQGTCCPHPHGLHGPDGACRACAVTHGGQAGSCTGWTPAWSYVASGAEAGNSYVVGVEVSGDLPCSTEGCGHRAVGHYADEAQPSGLGPCRVDGCSCGQWTYVIPGSAEDALRSALQVAGAMAEAIGAAMSDEDTAMRTFGALREQRAAVEVVLAYAEDDDVVDAEVGSSGDPLLDLVHDVLARHFPADPAGRWLRARDELTDAVRAAAQVSWS